MPADRPVPPAFVRAHTRPARPSLVPEVELLVAADVVALWEAMEERAGGALSEPPFWAAAWPGGQALARHVLDHPELVAGRSVLDLGSGSGLVAVAAALAGAARVVASEIDPFGVTAIGLNAELNGVPPIAVVGDVLGGDPPTWTSSSPGTSATTGSCPSGCCRTSTRPGPRGAEVLLGDPGRPYVPNDRLAAVATVRRPRHRARPRPTQVRRTTVWRLP